MLDDALAFFAFGACMCNRLIVTEVGAPEELMEAMICPCRRMCS